MSLVNKMLRDLDARHVDAAERSALPAAVTPLARHEQPARLAPRLINAGLLVMVLGGVIAWFQLQQPRTDSAASELTASRASAPPSRPPASPVAAAPAMPASSESAPPPAPVAADGPSLNVLRLADELARPPVEVAREKTQPTKAVAEPRREAVPATRREAAPAQRREPVATVPAATSTPAAVAAPAPAVAGETRVEKVDRQPTAAERAEQAYRHGLGAQRQGNVDGAISNLRTALDEQPAHAGARQALATLLIEQRHLDEAEDVLRKGIDQPASALASTLALARLKVERQQVPAALEILLRNAALGERSAEYQGFTGALLNRVGRAAEAADRYRMATRLAPAEARWWAGLGISLESSGRPAEAREAYLKARSLPGLPPDLAQYVEQRVR